MRRLTMLACAARLGCGSEAGILAACSAVTLVLACAGPQPLDRAIDPQDETGFLVYYNQTNSDAATAYVNWMADERHTTSADILEADQRLSQKHNPFDAHHDARAVSRGAVLYKLQCARCHADDARGRGPSTLEDHPATDFKTFGKRLTATLHRGAPRKWFRVIRDGDGAVVMYPEGQMTAMPAFGDQLTREQIWLAITYLQSLDVHANAPADQGQAP